MKKNILRVVSVALLFAAVLLVAACVEQAGGDMGFVTQAITNEEARSDIEKAYEGGDLGSATVEVKTPPKDSHYLTGDVWVIGWSSASKQVCDMRTRTWATEVNFGILCYRLSAFCCNTIHPYPNSPPMAYCDVYKLECYPAMW